MSEEQGVFGNFKWANCVSSGNLKSKCGLRWAKSHLLIVFLWYVSYLSNSCTYIHKYSDKCSVHTEKKYSAMCSVHTENAIDLKDSHRGYFRITSDSCKLQRLHLLFVFVVFFSSSTQAEDFMI